MTSRLCTTTRLYLALCAAFCATLTLGAKDTQNPIPTLEDKIRGSIFGAALGDALGAPTEFLDSMEKIKKAYPPQGIQKIDDLLPSDYGLDARGNLCVPYTDDTAMSILVLNVLTQRVWTGKTTDDSYEKLMSSLAISFIEDKELTFGWARPQRAPGNTCLKSVATLAQLYSTSNGTPSPR